MNNKFMKSLALWLIIILGAFLLYNASSSKRKVKNISYSDFKYQLRAGNIESVIIEASTIKGDFILDGNKTTYKTVKVQDRTLLEELEKYNVKDYRGQVQKSWLPNILFYFGPVILFLFIWFIMIRQMNSGGKQAMSFGRSKAKLNNKDKNKTTFADVAGVDECTEELQEIIGFLKNPKKFQKLGGKIPKGVLLYGAPGTGKTLLARAVAGEAGVPFFSASGSEFVEMFVGVGASRVRDLFDKGRRNAPCLLFVDEIDAVGRHRFAGIGGGHDEREQTLNQLLIEMDGFDSREGVILIAATNRPDVLDPAILRPGRFDRQIVVTSPDIKGREEILKIHTKNIKLNKDADLNIIARHTPGFVGSDLANICNEAALIAARYDKNSVETKDLEAAIERVIAGPEKKSRVISDKEKETIAYHEAGHAVVAKLIPKGDPVHKVSIIARGPALGYTLQLPVEDKYLTTKHEMLDKIAVLLGGRVAEEMFCDDITTGAQNDLSRVTSMIQKMVCEYGMSNLGPITYRKGEEEVFLGRDISRSDRISGDLLKKIDNEVFQIVSECYDRARVYLKTNSGMVKNLVEKLMKDEVVFGEELDKILGKAKKTVRKKK